METVTITYTQTRKVWRYPPSWSRFVVFSGEPPSWVRYFGIGEEVEEEVTTTIPRAFVKEVKPDGTFVFGCLPDGEMEFNARSTIP